MVEPVSTRYPHGGIQKIYKFDNGYGASVVQHSFSYGNRDGQWEIGVIKWEGDSWGLTYDTPITSDVLGYVPEEEVAHHLANIQALPPHKPEGEA